MKVLRSIPIFLILLPLFFCLHGTAENFGSLTFKEVTITGISVLLTTLFFFGLYFLFTRKMLLAALIAFFISCWFFFFGAIHDLIRSIAALRPLYSYSVLLPLLLVVTAAWIIYLRRKDRNLMKLTLYLNVLLLIYCLIDLGKIGYQALSTGNSAKAFPFNYNAVTQKRDVFLLVFDGYPGRKSLADSFGYSNEPMYRALAADSFTFLPVSANYNVTQFSMSSVLNMDHIKAGYDPNRVTQTDIRKRQDEINDAAVVDIFEKMGYRVQNNSLFDIKNIPGTADVNGFILGHNRLLTDKILTNRMKRDLGAGLPSSVVRFIPFMKDRSEVVHQNYNADIAKKTLAAVHGNKARPLFCYAHFIMPHGPYLFDSLGRPSSRDVNAAPGAWMDRRNFISYLAYTNDFAQRLIAGIIEKDPQAIIIFMSDHGFREYRADNSVQDAHFDNIAAIRLPNHQHIPPDTLTNVNLFRYLFNVKYNQRLDYLPDLKVALKLQ